LTVIPKTRNGTNANGTESHGTQKNRSKTRKRNLEHGTIKKRNKKITFLEKKFFLIYFRLKCGNGTIKTRKRKVPHGIILWLFFIKKKTIPFD